MAKQSDMDLKEFTADDRVDLILLQNNTFMLSGEIDQDNVDNCIRWILSENFDRSQRKTLTLYINSTGGDLYCAFALIDVMKGSFHSIRTIGIGAVMSAAFLIFASGQKGQRYAAKNTSFMSHQYSETFTGKHHDLKATMKEGENYNNKMVEVLKEATGLSTTRIKTKLLPASDVYMSAAEAIEFGVADLML